MNENGRPFASPVLRSEFRQSPFHTAGASTELVAHNLDTRCLSTLAHALEFYPALNNHDHKY